MDAFTGEIRAFAFNWAPENWSLCNGASIPINQNQALYSVLGSAFGGTKDVSFNLPNMLSATTTGMTIGLAPMGMGAGPDLTARTLGTPVGAPTVSLDLSKIASHNHSLTFQVTPTVADRIGAAVTGAVPSNPGVATGTTITNIHGFAAGTANTTLASAAVGVVGGATPHENRQPQLTVNFCMCTAGFYPIRQN